MPGGRRNVGPCREGNLSGVQPLPLPSHHPKYLRQRRCCVCRDIGYAGDEAGPRRREGSEHNAQRARTADLGCAGTTDGRRGSRARAPAGGGTRSIEAVASGGSPPDHPPCCDHRRGTGDHRLCPASERSGSVVLPLGGRGYRRPALSGRPRGRPAAEPRIEPPRPPRWIVMSPRDPATDVRPGCRWPVRVVLTLDQRRRLGAIVRRTRPRCPACGSLGLTIGPTMAVGFLAHRAEPKRWSIEVRCAGPSCPTPVAPFELPAGQFL